MGDKLPVLLLLMELVRVLALVHVDWLDLGRLEGGLVEVLELNGQRVRRVKLLDALLAQKSILSFGLKSLSLLLDLLLELGH